VNSNCQTHEVKKSLRGRWRSLHVAADKNPTWTIMALSWRTSEYIATQLKSEDPVKRREAVGTMALASLAAAFRWTPAEAQRVAKLVRESVTPYAPTFFTAHEWETVKVLADLVIPRDERSGSATDAAVAGVHGLHDGRSAGRPGTDARRARVAGQ